MLVNFDNFNKRKIMKKDKKQPNRRAYFDGHANVWLPTEIHKALKVRAAQEGLTLKQMFAKTVNLYLKNNLINQE